jgi:hypothetical protein
MDYLGLPILPSSVIHSQSRASGHPRNHHRRRRRAQAAGGNLWHLLGGAIDGAVQGVSGDWETSPVEEGLELED